VVALGVPSMTVQALRNIGVFTVGELLDHSFKELKSLGISKASLIYINFCLGVHGLKMTGYPRKLWW
jgi:hypothetical protein